MLATMPNGAVIKRLLDAPAHRVEELDNGAVRILLVPNPNDWGSR